MLFRKKIEPRCAYCTKGSPLNENEVACVKRGIVDAAFHCGGFCYDPLKRVPPRHVTPESLKLSSEDCAI